MFFLLINAVCAQFNKLILYSHSLIAFSEGFYPNLDGSDFRGRKYVNLHAIVATILLDIESPSFVIDADPTSGSLVEPMLRLTIFLRAMKFQTNSQPSNPNYAGSVVDELSLLLTAGRLNSESRSLIVDAFEGEANNAAGIRVAQKLMASIPEFHSTTLFENLSQSRPETETPEVSSKRYKAVCNGLFFDR